MSNTILFFSMILLAIVIGTKKKINIGLVAAAFAFPIGTIVCGLSPNAIISLFPTTLFLNFLLATFLFGFAGCNGTLKNLARHLIYLSRNAGWMLGLLFFLVTALIAALGAGGSAPFFMSAICFSLALQAGINPLLVPLAVWTGAMVGGNTPWVSGYATRIGQLEIYFDPLTASRYVVGYQIWRAVFYTVLYIVMFILLKGYKVNKEAIELKKPQPFDAKQMLTLKIIIAMILLIVVPAVLQSIIPCQFTNMLTKVFCFQLLAILGIIANIAGKTAPYEVVIKERIPWDTLIMLSLTGIYMALANSLGLVEFMSELLQNKIPAAWIVPGIVAIMCILSFFVSGNVIIPMVLPLLSVFSIASNTSVAVIYCAAQVGLTASSISPFSQGGAAALSGCEDNEIRKKLLKQQTILSGVFSVVVFLIAIAGGFSMLHD